MNNESILPRSRDFLGKFLAISSQSLYVSISFWIIDILPSGGGLTRMKIQLAHKFEDIISVENLLDAWKEFLPGKRNKLDVQLFASALIDNILELHNDLVNKTYKHGGYYQFKISDPKPRDISKASVRDRLLHHAIYRRLYPFFDRTFIADSFSCRKDKGTHKAIKRLQRMYFQVSRNNTRTCWVLKLDIRKFFACIDHEILIRVLKQYIPDQDILWLLQEIIKSFNSTMYNNLTDRYVYYTRHGLPLGNLTSQLFVNIYMNQFDQFIKHKLKVWHYIRYADDFVILSRNKSELTLLLDSIRVFLKQELKLSLHPNKITLKTFASGVDFLGWVNFPNHRVLRTATKRRMFKKMTADTKTEVIQSYLGLLSHGNTAELQEELKNRLGK